ncbi:predicted protein, partial [Naegleria gruberi]
MIAFLSVYAHAGKGASAPPPPSPRAAAPPPPPVSRPPPVAQPVSRPPPPPQPVARAPPPPPVSRPPPVAQPASRPASPQPVSRPTPVAQPVSKPAAQPVSKPTVQLKPASVGSPIVVNNKNPAKSFPKEGDKDFVGPVLPKKQSAAALKPVAQPTVEKKSVAKTDKSQVKSAAEKKKAD